MTTDTLLGVQEKAKMLRRVFHQVSRCLKPTSTILWKMTIMFRLGMYFHFLQPIHFLGMIYCDRSSVWPVGTDTHRINLIASRMLQLLRVGHRPTEPRSKKSRKWTIYIHRLRHKRRSQSIQWHWKTWLFDQANIRDLLRTRDPVSTPAVWCATLTLLMGND